MNLHHALLILAASASPAYSSTVRRRHLQADPTPSPTSDSLGELPVLVKSKNFPLENW